MTQWQVIVGDCRDVLATLPEQHFHTCVTSPPYFGLRDYGVDGQIGLEPTPEDFVACMVEVFSGVRRTLRDDGVLWLNLGDSYNSGSGGYDPKYSGSFTGREDIESKVLRSGRADAKLKPKDLLGMPWRVAFALQADGWYLRDAIIWHKPSPMTGSQRDRCTSAYEMIFQLTKRARYWFDLEAIKEPAVSAGRENRQATNQWRDKAGKDGVHPAWAMSGNWDGRSHSAPRNVWRIASAKFSEAHFATFPREIPARCIKAATSGKGCCGKCGAGWQRVILMDRQPSRNSEGSKAIGRERMETGHRDPDRHITEASTIGWLPCCECYGVEPIGPTGKRIKASNASQVREYKLRIQQAEAGAHCVPARVLDPFNGAGTTGLGALGCDYTGIELNPEYADMSRRRIRAEQPLWATEVTE